MKHISGDVGESRDRVASLDSLRGFAIVLMIIDHVAALWFGSAIADSPVRIGARLAMPLFCVLMGFFMGRSGISNRRLAELTFAALLVNAIFYPLYGCVDILASLAVVAVIGRVAAALSSHANVGKAGGSFGWLVLVVLAYPFDPTDGWPDGGPMDFPLSLVLGFVALGRWHAVYGWPRSVPVAVAMTALYPVATSMTPGSVSPLLLLFVLPAIMLLGLAQRYPEIRLFGLDRLGRHPLTAYVIQYFVIVAVAKWGLG